MEDRDRIARDINNVVVRRLYSAGLDIQSALGLVGGHRAAGKLQRAVAELDQAITELRDAVFGTHRRDSPGGGTPG